MDDSRPLIDLEAFRDSPRDHEFPQYPVEVADFVRTIGHTPRGGDILPPDQIDWSRYDIAEEEIWVRDAFRDRFAWLRENDPVHYHPNSMFGPYWSVTRYEDVKAVDMNHEQFSSSADLGGVTLMDMDDDFKVPMFIAADPPVHTAQRKTVHPALAVEKMRDYEPDLRLRTAELLDSLPVNTPFDWVDKVSIELTTTMLAILFDFPLEDRRKLTRWSDVTIGRFDPDICPGGYDQWTSELLECLDYFSKLWKARVNQAGAGKDFISMMAQSQAMKDMPPMEFLGNLLLLIVGGNDTTRTTMTTSVLALHHFPEELVKLKADPGLIPNMIQELLRWSGPNGYMRRTALADVELGGKKIAKGDKVLIWYVSANHDDRVFPDPERFDITRENAKRHLAFGIGVHRCIGAQLAELQMRVLWEEILKRFDRIEVLEQPRRVPNPFVRGIRKMEVIIHKSD